MTNVLMPPPYTARTYKLRTLVNRAALAVMPARVRPSW
jgi:hypothetical protein